MKRKIFIYGFLIAIVDQIVKLLVTTTMTLNTNVPIIKDIFNLNYVQNEGAAWNIFSGSRWFLIIISIIALFAIVKYFLLDLKIYKIELVGYSFLLGGIVGNLIDRLVRGYVVDYLSFNIFGYDFPIVNIADISITIGASLIIFHLIRGVKNENNKH